MIMAQVLQPMMLDVNLSEFRQLLGQAVSELRQGIDIWCLRDLEKLILHKRGHLSEGCTATSYMKLCYEFLLRSSPLWDDKLSDLDLYRPADPPYHRGYLPDAMHEVKGRAQMVFQIRSEEIDNIMKSILQPVATTEVDGGRGQSKRDVPHSAGTGTGKLLKRQLSELPDARRSRKKPKVCDNSSKPKTSSERPSVSAAAGAFDHTTGLITMQPPPLPSNQDVSATTLLQQIVSTNSVPQHPTNYLTVGPPCDIDFINNSSFGTSDFDYGDFSTTSGMEYQQTKQSQSPIVSQAMHDGSTQNCFIPRSSSDSPSTVAQSDVSVSPGSARRRNVPKQTEESHSCEKCNKRFPRACDLKKHRKTHDRPYKCTVLTCNYYTMGFSAEKDRDRHFHDKHDKDAPRHKCGYNCSYSSPRESNVKQHMEKAHGYVYVRTKTVQQKSKSAAGTTSAKPTARATATSRPRRVRRTSSPSQPPLSVASSVQSTPVTMESEYPSSNDSPLFDIDDTISPETMKDELSPDMRPMQFFPPLPESSDSVIPTAFMFRNSDAQHPMAADVYEHSPHTSIFSDPSEALEARRTQQISGVEAPLFPVDGGHWNYMNPAARSDPHLGGDSPESDFANDFLRDAPSHVTDRLRPAAPIDPGLPVVDNSYYDAKRDVFPME
ncbi:hypothetical protein K440DRAFT_376373 [Wilcoxina mikolae CBS 423.85]|nr:hypothetical protein K440DRAFT_376373 [Wilcoxina mikolae CBS 423.85]